jgi:hypothetical protein
MSELHETKSTSKNGLFLAIIGVLVLVVAFLGFKISGANSALTECEKKNKTLNEDLDGLSNMMSSYSGNMTNDLKADFQNMLKTYDQLKAKDASQADSINAQKAKIQGLLDQLKSNKRFSARELYNMRKENETLRNIMKGYVKQIDSLFTLTTQLNADLETKTSELNETSADRDNFKNQAEAANEKVKKGSKLQAYGFSSSGLRMKINSTTEETNKAKNTSMVKSSFTIGENTIANAGRRYVYMQVISPDGRTLQSKSSNTMQTDAGTMAYSDKKEIDYNNQSIDVAIYYSQDQEFTKGTYKIKIYCDNQLIGSDSFTLK